MADPRPATTDEVRAFGSASLVFGVLAVILTGGSLVAREDASLFLSILGGLCLLGSIGLWALMLGADRRLPQPEGDRG